MNFRMERLHNQFMHEISDIIRKELKDPRLGKGFITLTDIEITRDLSIAKAYISVMGANEVKALEGLNSSAGYIRTVLGKRLHIRKIPAIKFFLDQTAKHADEINRHLDKIKTEDEQ